MEASARPPRIVVIGVGNAFRRDDGVGPVVVDALARHGEHSPLPPGTGLFVCDGEPVRLLTLWQGADLAVVVDAALARPPRPGRIHRIGTERVLRAAAHATAGSHGLGLRTAVELARALGRLPAHLIVYAVEAADTRAGPGMTSPVRAAVAPLVRRIAADVARHARPAAP
ncbi:hypothetical protein GCM10018793_43460 [Streptomyces sulfonofaciens]|uniref:Hydrogenase maturation protease n=1 Tax=Streptomyces sulfonofaciens TaxID=68272 RepID=A0A919GDW7_9ACTN|nr:hydrogenase maturation protease [Streptomyces sulfonofaciens]GHH82847.1 hypothetical protein GCM10018793_43460 [Streptomyces sulfonofaciens]